MTGIGQDSEIWRHVLTMSLDKTNHVHQEHVRVLCKANLRETRGRATKEQSKGTPRERTMKTVQ